MAVKFYESKMKSYETIVFLPVFIYAISLSWLQGYSHGRIHCGTLLYKIQMIFVIARC